LIDAHGDSVGVDATSEMIAQFQQKIDTRPNLKGKAVARQLFLERADQLDRKFDLVCSTYGQYFNHRSLFSLPRFLYVGSFRFTIFVQGNLPPLA